jgi:hypothetical protein
MKLFSEFVAQKNSKVAANSLMFDVLIPGRLDNSFLVCYRSHVRITHRLFDNVENNMTRDEARGQAALVNLDKYTRPECYFVSGDGGAGEKLYDLERRRNDIIHDCARQWMKIAKISDKEHWFRGVPQALHDTLESYQTECGIMAAEAFLLRHGWTVTRPEKQV